jgi:hypothetical protein
MSCKSIILYFSKPGPQEAVTAKAAQRLRLKKNLAGIASLPSQIIQALVMALYPAVTTFAFASQVSLPALYYSL